MHTSLILHTLLQVTFIDVWHSAEAAGCLKELWCQGQSGRKGRRERKREGEGEREGVGEGEGEGEGVGEWEGEGEREGEGGSEREFFLISDFSMSFLERVLRPMATHFLNQKMVWSCSTS